MNEYKIYHFNAKTILKRGIKENNIIVCNDNVTRLALSQEETKYDSQLFYQIRLELGDTYPIEEVIVIFNFDEFSHKDYQEFKKYDGGITLTIHDKKINFSDFLKSNSMSKNSDIYYINIELKDRIVPRVTFGFEYAENVPMAKWYAYSGLVNSNCHIIEGFSFTSDEIAIIADKKEVVRTDCISGVSYLYLEELTTDYINDFNNEEHLDKFICFQKSKDFKTLPENMQKWINEVVLLSDVDSLKNSLNFLEEENKAEIESNEIKWYKLELKNYPVEINLFDGQGFIYYDEKDANSFIHQIRSALPTKTTVIAEYNDETYDTDISEEEKENSDFSFQIRLPFIKGEVHACNFKKFYKNHRIKTIHGIYRDYDVSKLKLILTESQFKGKVFLDSLGKGIEYYFELLNKYHYYFGISGLEPNKRDQQVMSYQYLSTLPAEEVFLNIDTMIDRTEDHLRRSLTPDEIIKGLSKQDRSAYEIAAKVYGLSPEFYQLSKIYKDHFNKIYKSYLTRYQMSRLTLPGFRKLLCSDLLELLYYSCGKACPNTLQTSDLYCPNTKFHEPKNYSTDDDPNRKSDEETKPYYCLLFRNPHYSRNEIGALKFATGLSRDREEFFSHLTGVVMQNPRSFTAERLGGADYDGDEIIISNYRLLNQPMLEKQALGKRTKGGFKLNEPFVKIPSLKPKKVKSLLDFSEKVRCLESTFKNKVGLISNIAFGKTFEAYTKNPTLKPSDIAFYTILGGLEIDSAKNGRKPDLSQIIKENKDGKHHYLVVKDNVVKHQRTKGKNFTQSSKYLMEHRSSHPLFYIYDHFKNAVKKDDYYVENDLGYNARYFDTIYAPVDINEEGGLLHYERIILIDKLYSILVENLKHEDHGKELETIKDMIISTFTANDIIFGDNILDSFDDFLDAFITENPKQTLETYFTLSKDLPFHYMTDEYQKRNFIEKLFGYHTIKDEYMEMITNFDNDGYRVLYLLLRYAVGCEMRLDDYSVKIKDKPKRKDYEKLFKGINNEIIQTLSEEELIDLFKQTNNTIEALISLAKQENFTKVSEYRKFFIEKLQEMTEDIYFEDLAYVYKWEQERILFDVYEKATLSFLKEVKDSK